MSHPVLAIPCYRKAVSLVRLHRSLAAARYPGPVRLVYSVDGGGSEEVRARVESFEWPHGEKEIVLHPANLGLKGNLLFCGDLSQQHGSVIVLDDDCFVGPDFYAFALAAREAYAGEERVAGISLYAYEYSEVHRGRFYPVHHGGDIYFMQWTSSRGQLWTAGQWRSFRGWYAEHRDEDLAPFPIPRSVVNWGPNSWKKYSNAYLADTGRYFVYPQVSFSSSCGDPGVHVVGEGFVGTQVPLPLDYDAARIRFAPLSDTAVRYDPFFEIEPGFLRRNPRLRDYDFDVDLGGAKRIADFTRPYALSCKRCRNPVLTFGHPLVPLALNALHDCEGDYLSLGRVEDFSPRETLERRVRRALVNRLRPAGKPCLDFLALRALTKARRLAGRRG